VLTLSKSFDDESKAEEGEEDAVEFLEAGEDTPVAFESAKEPLDLIAFLVKRPVIAPRINAIGFGWYHRNHAQFEHQVSRLVAS
jgi:hypothetical protein